MGRILFNEDGGSVFPEATAGSIIERVDSADRNTDEGCSASFKEGSAASPFPSSPVERTSPLRPASAGLPPDRVASGALPGSSTVRGFGGEMDSTSFFGAPIDVIAR